MRRIKLFIMITVTALIFTAVFSVSVFAQEQTKDFFLGDADGDKVVTVMDTTLIQKSLAGVASAVIEKEDYTYADVDSDTKVSVLDACFIQKWLAHINVEYQINQRFTKTWHKAEYRYVDHPAEYKNVWVVDQAAYSYEEPVYGYEYHTFCNQCGADLSGGLLHSHMEENEGSCWSYHDERIKVQTGIRTVDVAEKGHWEKKVKDAWTEKILVREAGYY